MFTHRSREGYVIIDHRYSPGVTAEFVKNRSPVVGAGQVFESATMTCAHCNAIVVLNPDRSRLRGFCRSCNHYVCDSPFCNSECRPFKKLLDMAQECALKEMTNG